LNGFIIDFSNSLYNYTNLKKLIYEWIYNVIMLLMNVKLSYIIING
jgi:hypothetical protein